MTDTSYDPALYHRALTGRGAPITGDEVIALLEAIEARDAADATLQTRFDALEDAHDDAWIVPKDEPHRPCTLCTLPDLDRGDGRCERHGRVIAPPPIEISTFGSGKVRRYTVRLAPELRA